MKLNSGFFNPIGYGPPMPATTFASPQELVQLLIYDRAFTERVGGEGWGPSLSKGGLRDLVNLVFYTSMCPDEGRFLRFKVAAVETKGALFSIARFAPVHLDGPDALRRLAPACTHPKCALLVAERDNRLYCDGVVNVGSMGYEWFPGKPEVAAVGHPPMCQLTVRDPGHLIAAGSIATSYELRAGKVRRLSPYWALEPVHGARADFCEYLRDEIVRRGGQPAATVVGDPMHSQLFIHALSRMLRTAVEARHGGAFVLLPGETPDPWAFDIHVKYLASHLDLGLDAVNFWLGCVDYARSNADESLLRHSVVLRTKMLTDAEFAGNLSAVDGCVVLNRRLQVCGFGGEIRVSDKQAREARRVFRDAKSGEEWPYDEFTGGIGGTRHKSAARLCKAHPNVLAFVVSQDGDLKLFASDDAKVNGFGPLDLPMLGDSMY
jgi:hypothetical protein